jgi:hypothetical protein
VADKPQHGEHKDNDRKVCVLLRASRMALHRMHTRKKELTAILAGRAHVEGSLPGSQVHHGQEAHLGTGFSDAMVVELVELVVEEVRLISLSPHLLIPLSPRGPHRGGGARSARVPCPTRPLLPARRCGRRGNTRGNMGSRRRWWWTTSICRTEA